MSTRFHSHETGQAFTNCCDCGCDLQNTGIYIINQSYVGEECVFEFAMCVDCREQMNEQLSEQSRVAMFDFIHDHADMHFRENVLGNNSKTDAYIDTCITCGEPRAACKSYTLGAMFTGNHLIKGPFPMLICGECEAKLGETISDETRNFWDQFIAEHFPGPPSEIDLPTLGKPLII